MPHYEVIYETGEVSVANYADDAEAMKALTEQNLRATTGRDAGPQGGPASRIAKVFIYDEHPGSLNEDGGLSADVLTSDLKDLVKQYTDKNGVVNVMVFAEAVAGLVHPMVPGDINPHDTRFKMESSGELDLSTLNK
jgi:hypothetical protein